MNTDQISKALVLIIIMTVTSASIVFAKFSKNTHALRLTMVLEKTIIRIGESANITLRLTNIGTKIVTLHFSNSHVNDIYLYSSNLELITFLTKGCGFLQVLIDIRLEPGETKEWNISWMELWKKTEIKPGKYYLQGEVFGAPKTCFHQIVMLPRRTLLLK